MDTVLALLAVLVVLFGVLAGPLALSGALAWLLWRAGRGWPSGVRLVTATSVGALSWLATSWLAVMIALFWSLSRIP